MLASQLMSIEDYQAATSIPPVRGQSEPRGRHLSAGELRSLFEACSGPSNEGQDQDSTARRRRDAAFLALAYSCGLRRSEAVVIDVANLDLLSGELRVRRGKGRKPRQITLPPSALPALEDWLQARGSEPGPLFCPVLKSGRLPGKVISWLASAPAAPGGSVANVVSKPRSWPPPPMTCAGPGSGTCSTSASTWHRAEDGGAC